MDSDALLQEALAMSMQARTPGSSILLSLCKQHLCHYFLHAGHSAGKPRMLRCKCAMPSSSA